MYTAFLLCICLLMQEKISPLQGDMASFKKVYYATNVLYEGALYQHTPYNSNYANASLELVLEPQSGEQYVKEPLRLVTKVKNVGEGTVVIPLSLTAHSSVFVRVFDEYKNHLFYEGEDSVSDFFGNYTRTKTKKLKPNAFWKSEEITRNLIILDKPGVYYLQARGYLSTHKNKTPVWEGYLVSKPLKIMLLPAHAKILLKLQNRMPPKKP